MEVQPTGHSICDFCGDLDAQELALGTRNDAAAVQRRREIDEDRANHQSIHSAGRKVFDDAT